MTVSPKWSTMWLFLLWWVTVEVGVFWRVAWDPEKCKLVFCIVILPLWVIVTYDGKRDFSISRVKWGLRDEERKRSGQFWLTWRYLGETVPENMPHIWFGPIWGLPCPDLGIFFQALELLCYRNSIAMLQPGSGIKEYLWGGMVFSASSSFEWQMNS